MLGDERSGPLSAAAVPAAEERCAGDGLSDEPPYMLLSPSSPSSSEPACRGSGTAATCRGKEAKLHKAMALPVERALQLWYQAAGNAPELYT